MGGVWERLIRTVRSVFSILLQEQRSQLDDEALRTLMTEVENAKLVRAWFSRTHYAESLADFKTEIVLPPPGSCRRSHCPERLTLAD